MKVQADAARSPHLNPNHLNPPPSPSPPAHTHATRQRQLPVAPLPRVPAILFSFKPLVEQTMQWAANSVRALCVYVRRITISHSYAGTEKDQDNASEYTTSFTATYLGSFAYAPYQHRATFLSGFVRKFIALLRLYSHANPVSINSDPRLVAPSFDFH